MIARLALAVSLLWACGCCGSVQAQEPPPVAVPAPSFDYRRVFVPQQEIEKFTAGYLPLPRDKFETLAKQLQAAADQPALLAQTRLATADYWARLDGDQLVGGLVLWQVSGALAGSPEVQLGPCSLALDDLRWDATPPRPAWWAATPRGELVLRGEPPGVLRGQFTKQGERDTAGVVRFSCQWPAAPIVRVYLDLPTGVQLESSEGFAAPVVAVDAAAAQFARDSAGIPSPRVEAGRRLWLLQASGRRECELTLRSEAAAATPSVRFRQQSTHILHERGGELLAEYRLSAAVGLPREIAFEVDRALRVAGVKAGEQTLSWSLDQAVDGKSQTLRVDLGPLAERQEAALQIQALHASFSNAARQLPAIRSPEMKWERGLALVQCLAPLELRHTRITHGRATKAAPLGGDTPGESWEFELFQPNAEIEVELAARAGIVEAECITSVDLNAAGDWLRHTAAFTSPLAGARTLQGRVTGDWIIDDVETLPAGGVSEWQATQAGQQLQLLDVQLQRGLAPGKSLVLSVRARRSGSQAGDAFPLPELLAVHWPHVRSKATFLALRTEPPLRAQWPAVQRGLEVASLAAAPPELTAPLALKADATLVRVEHPSDQALCRLQTEPPRFRAHWHAALVLEADGARDRWRLTCQPESGGMQQITVLCSHADDSPPTWRFADDPTEPVQVESTPLAAGDARATGLLWELSWRKPRTAAFDLIGERPRTLALPLAVALAAAPAATEQTGLVSVHAAGEMRPQVKSVLSRPALVDRQRGAGLPPVVKAYHYDPGQDAFLEQPPCVVLAEHEPTAEAALWAWDYAHTAYWPASGREMQRAEFRCENHGRSHVAVTLPAGAELRRTLVDGTAVQPILRGGDWEIPLDAARTFVSLTLEYDHQGEARSRRSPALALLHAPVLHRRLFAYVSPELHASDDSQGHWSLLLGNLSPRSAFQGEPAAVPPWSLVAQAAWEQRLRSGTLGAWGDWLSQLETTLRADDEQLAATENTVLLIDALALGAQGLSADAPLALASRAPPTSIQDVWRARHLAWVRFDGAWVLTSSEFAAEPVAEQLATGHRFQSPALWAKSSLAPVWTTAAMDSIVPSAAWTHLRLRTPTNGAPTLRVWHGARWQAWGWGLSLVALALVVWRRSGRVAFACCAFAATILFVAWGSPESLLAEGVALGSLLGGILWCVDVALSRVTPLVRSTGSASTTAPLRIPLTLVLLGCWAASAPAAENPNSPAPAELHRILVPVDEAQRPVGEYLYVPRSMYEAFHKKAAALESPGEPWFLASAVYRGALAASANGELAPTEITAEWQLETNGPNVSVKLPFRQAEISLLPDRSLLDGVPVALDWQGDPPALLATVPTAGSHRLEIAFHAAAGPRDAAPRVDFAVPPAARARLEWRTPPEATDIRVPSSLGAVRWEGERERIVAELGPTPRLLVQWPPKEAQPRLSQFTTTSTMYWLRLGSHSTSLMQRVSLNVASGDVRELSLRVDSRLQLAPLAADHPARALVSPAEPRKLTLQFKEPVTGAVTFDLRWLLSDVAGSGDWNIPLPRWETMGSERRWLGISLSPELEYSPAAAAAPETVTTDDFLAAWGGAEAGPSAVLRLSSGDASRTLLVKAKTPQPRVSQKLDVSFGLGTAQLQYEASCDAVGDLFQQPILLPEGARVLGVEAFDGDTPQPARWSHAGRNLVVFTTFSTTARRRLKIEAEVAVAPGDQPVPLVTAAAADSSTLKLRAFRRPEVSLAVTAFEGAPAPQSALEPLAMSLLGRLAAQWELVGEFDERVPAQRIPRVTIAPNNLTLAGLSVVMLERDREAWRALVNVQGKTVQGVADQLQLDVSDAWQPTLLEPAGTLAIADLPGETRRRITCTPLTPLSGDWKLKLQLTSTTAARDRPRAPAVTVSQFQNDERYWVLPQTSETGQLLWETRGLRPAVLPLVAGSLAPAGGAQVFRAIAAEPSAVLGKVERAARLPHVALADIRFGFTAEGESFGLAQFDLDPADLRELHIQLPNGVALLAAQSCEQPLAITQVDASQARVSLPVAHLPQRVELLFTWNDERSLRAGQTQLAAPELINVEVRRTTWTVAVPNDWKVAFAEDLQLASPLEIEQARLRSATGLIAAARDAGSELGTDELWLWFRPWARQFAAVERGLAPALATGEGDPFVLAETRLSLTQQGSFASALGMAEVHEQARQARRADSPSEAWQSLLGRHTLTHVLADGPLSEISVDLTPPASGFAWRWLLALVSAALAWLGVGRSNWRRACVWLATPWSRRFREGA